MTDTSRAQAPATADELETARLAAAHYQRPATDIPALVAFERHRAAQGHLPGMPGLSGAIPNFIAGFHAAATPAAAAPTYWNSQRKMIERAIIGLRDGWASRKDADDALAALAASPAAAPQQAVPEGYKLVPDEMTDEMYDAAAAARCNYRAEYRAAIAAAPVAAIEQPPAPLAYLITWKNGTRRNLVYRLPDAAELKEMGNPDDLRATPLGPIAAPVAQLGAPDDPTEVLMALLWMYRRLPHAYGRPPSLEAVINTLAKTTGTDVSNFLAERSSTEASAQAEAHPHKERADKLSTAELIQRLRDDAAGGMACDVFMLDRVAGLLEQASTQAAPDAVRNADTERMDWLEERQVDTIYFDDHKIMDVGGSKRPHDIRAAIDALRTQPPADSQNGANHE